MITSGGVRNNYKYNIRPHFESLLSREIDSKDKIAIQDLLQKPWNPYIRRHSALTEKSKILKEHILRTHAGWSTSSKMPEKYIHYFGNESSEAILEAYGLKPKDEEINKMQPVQCPNCSESNKIDSRFCHKCRMILTYDEIIKITEEKGLMEKQLTEIRDMMFSKIHDEVKAEVMKLTSQGISNGYRIDVSENYIRQQYEDNKRYPELYKSEKELYPTTDDLLDPTEVESTFPDDPDYVEKYTRLTGNPPNKNSGFTIKVKEDLDYIKRTGRRAFEIKDSKETD